ncbi:hypothetical protein D3C72_1743840 [compost metagenome]
MCARPASDCSVLHRSSSRRLAKPQPAPASSSRPCCRSRRCRLCCAPSISCPRAVPCGSRPTTCCQFPVRSRPVAASMKCLSTRKTSRWPVDCCSRVMITPRSTARRHGRSLPSTALPWARPATSACRSVSSVRAWASRPRCTCRRTLGSGRKTACAPMGSRCANTALTTA